jgi:hypothetical protein
MATVGLPSHTLTQPRLFQALCDIGIELYGPVDEFFRGREVAEYIRNRPAGLRHSDAIVVPYAGNNLPEPADLFSLACDVLCQAEADAIGMTKHGHPVGGRKVGIESACPSEKIERPVCVMGNTR